jgi:hypothetical protein
MSSITPLPELDLFGVPPTQLSILQDLVTEHRVIGNLEAGKSINFEINTAKNEYVKLNETEFYIKLRVDLEKKDDANVVSSCV